MSIEQHIFGISTIGNNPVPCSSCIFGEAVLAWNTFTISKPTIINAKHIGTEPRRKCLIISNAVRGSSCCGVSVEKNDGWMGFNGKWDSRFEGRVRIRLGEWDRAIEWVGEYKPSTQSNVVGSYNSKITSLSGCSILGDQQHSIKGWNNWRAKPYVSGVSNFAKNGYFKEFMYRTLYSSS